MSKRIVAKRAKRVTRVNRAVPAGIDTPQKIWLAGLGAVAVAQREGGKALETLIGEGKRMQSRTSRIARDVQRQASVAVSARVKPVRARLHAVRRDVEASLERGVGQVLSFAGVPSKADVDALVVRIDKLSRQLRSAR